MLSRSMESSPRYTAKELQYNQQLQQQAAAAADPTLQAVPAAASNSNSALQHLRQQQLLHS